MSASPAQELVVDEGAAICLEPLELAHLGALLRGNVDIRGEMATVSRVVGHIRMPTGRTLRIRSPKAPAAAVLAWAAFVDPRFTALRALSGKVPLGGGEGDIATLLARLLVLHMEEAVLRHGLLRQYRRNSAVTETVRGRIDFARLAREGANLGRLPCEVWERSAGTRVNRFLIAALDRCRRDPLLRHAAEPGLTRLSVRLAAVHPGVDGELLAGTAQLERSEQPFATVIALARMLLCEFGLADGADHLGSGFVLNLETLFERTVVCALREAGVDVVPKFPLPYRRVQESGEVSGARFEVDALCRNLPNGSMLVDAKYKRAISSENLHQIVAYSAMSGVRRAAFVVPAGMLSDRRRYRFGSVGGRDVDVEIFELATDGVSVAEWRENGRVLAARVLES